MNKLRWLAVLMGIAILAITGFQFYWLQQNYIREEKTLAIKTEMIFRTAIQKLQVSKLNLDSLIWNGKEKPGGIIRMSMEDDKNVKVRFSPKEEIVSTINVISDRLKDSLKIKKNEKSGVIIMNKTLDLIGDSGTFNMPHPMTGKGGNHLIELLYNVDSLQDSLRIVEIDSLFKKLLAYNRFDIPFTITRKERSAVPDFQKPNEITLGLMHPVTYKLKLGNTFPYLIKQITQPILFSILLLGITILSFVLLYKNLLRQRRLAEVKNEFISNITHELKTPIATVGVAIEALKNFNVTDNPQKTKEYLDISHNELQRLGLLVDKVLKLSMFEKKEIELRYETMNLREVVDEVISSLRLQLEKYKANISVTQEGDLTIEGDRLHLLSVIFNLIDNALKYSKDAPSIRVDLHEKGNNVVLMVSDNGIGLAPEYKNKIFDKFFRVPHGNTHNAKGYGLGLTYAAQVVKKHHGTIDVESQPGEGTKFTITLPKTPVI